MACHRRPGEERNQISSARRTKAVRKRADEQEISWLNRRKHRLGREGVGLESQQTSSRIKRRRGKWISEVSHAEAHAHNSMMIKPMRFIVALDASRLLVIP
jgi:hypothetical protein